jgi:hypothetical protein
MDVIPVDMVANALLAASYHTAMNPPGKRLPIYHVSTGSTNPVKWSQLASIVSGMRRREGEGGGARMEGRRGGQEERETHPCQAISDEIPPPAPCLTFGSLSFPLVSTPPATKFFTWPLRALRMPDA